MLNSSSPPLAVTVTTHVAVLFPSTVLTVIVEVPAATPVTTPALETVATEVALEVQVTFLFVALEGLTVATNVTVLPTLTDAQFVSNVTLVTETGVIVIVYVAETVPFSASAIAVIVALP